MEIQDDLTPMPTPLGAGIEHLSSDLNILETTKALVKTTQAKTAIESFNLLGSRMKQSVKEKKQSSTHSQHQQQ